MDETSRRTLDQALGEDFVADLGSLDIEELRRRRSLAEQEEICSATSGGCSRRRGLLAFEMERYAGRGGTDPDRGAARHPRGREADGRPAARGYWPTPRCPRRDAADST